MKDKELSYIISSSSEPMALLRPPPVRTGQVVRVSLQQPQEKAGSPVNGVGSPHSYNRQVQKMYNPVHKSYQRQ